jgi:aminoglycoside phosphotransferase (APT) family kinase protein
MKKQTAITSETAALVLQHHFGKKPRAVKRLHGGLVNHVFETRMGREDLILRISDDPAQLQVFMKEQWAVSIARKHKVPTPEILEVCNDVGGFPYMISRRVCGLSGITANKRSAVLRELGEYAAVINGIKTHDFGHIFDWSPNKLSRNRTWKEFLDNEIQLDGRLETFRRSGILEPANLKKLRQRAQLIRRWTATPTLTHGDLRLKNVILNERCKIVAILDWEDCMSNVAPYWELSIALHDLTMDEKQSFLEGYGLDLKRYMEIAPSIKALNILNYAPVLDRALQRKDAAKLLKLRARLNGAFDLYSL